MSVERGVSETSRIDRLLRSLGIDPRAYHALIHAYLLIDFRNQAFARATASGPKAYITPLFWVIGQNLLFTWLLSALLYARVDAFFFALLSLAGSMLVMATAVIVEFNEVVLDPDDLGIVGHLPIPVRTYSAARVTNLLGYVLLITVSLNVYPAIIGAGQQDAGWGFLPAYALACLVGNLLVVGVVILLYVVFFRERPTEGTQEIMAWNQIILIMVVFYGGQLVLRDTQGRFAMAAYQLPDWVAWLPPTWLAEFVASTGPAYASVAWWIAALFVLATLGVWAAVMARLSKAYAQMEPGGAAWRRTMLPPLPRPGDLAGRLTRWLTRPGDERTAYWLCATMLRRDHQLRMRSWPSLGVVLAAVVLGLATRQLADPVREPGPVCMLSLASIYLLAVPVPTILYNLKFSRDHAASWVLRAAPIEDRVALADGIRKAVLWRVLAPVLAALAVVFAIAWHDPLDVLLHVLAGWLVILAAGYASQIGILRDLPFAAPAARGETLGPIAVFAGILSGIAMLLAGVHYVAVQRMPWFLGYLAGMAAAVLVLRWASRQVLRRHFAVEVAAHE